MPTTVEGVYKEGVIELSEAPPTAREGKVLVTFLETDEKQRSAPQMLPYGKYKGPNESTEEDFKLAEWHGEDEFD